MLTILNKKNEIDTKFDIIRADLCLTKFIFQIQREVMQEESAVAMAWLKGSQHSLKWTIENLLSRFWWPTANGGSLSFTILEDITPQSVEIAFTSPQVAWMMNIYGYNPQRCAVKWTFPILNKERSHVFLAQGFLRRQE